MSFSSSCLSPDENLIRLMFPVLSVKLTQLETDSFDAQRAEHSSLHPPPVESWALVKLFIREVRTTKKDGCGQSVKLSVGRSSSVCASFRQPVYRGSRPKKNNEAGRMLVHPALACVASL